jgi:hypothetical protein
VCAEPATQLLAWDDSCGHLLCESCFWRVQMTHDHVLCGGTEACCPVCPPAVTAAVNGSWLGPACCSTAEERATRKATSVQKWLALAATEAEAEAREAVMKMKKKVKGGRIKALAEREAAALNPGWLQSDRVERLNEAACADDVLRILGILEVGADIDGRSECGETAAISAAMLGNAMSLRVLCWAGADLEIADAAGATPASVAAARGHHTALSAIHEFTQDGALCTAPNVMVAPAVPAALSSVCFHSAIDRREHPNHPGCDSGFADSGFSTSWLQRLDGLWAALPAHIADTTAANTSLKSYSMTCATRSQFCDAEGWVEAELAPLVTRLLSHTAGADMKLLGNSKSCLLPALPWIHQNQMAFVGFSLTEHGGEMLMRLT